MRHLLIACLSGAALALVGTVLGSDPEGAANLAGKTGLPEEGGKLSDVADQSDGLDEPDLSGAAPLE
jgi:hypothetical protein